VVEFVVGDVRREDLNEIVTRVRTNRLPPGRDQKRREMIEERLLCFFDNEHFFAKSTKHDFMSS